MKNETTMTIYAEALADNRNYKNARIDGKTVGVAEARAWGTAVKALRHSAYGVAQFNHANMSNPEAVTCNTDKLYESLRAVLDLVGVVNGAKLQAQNIAPNIVSVATRIRTIDITNEMAEARYEKRNAKATLDEEGTDEAQTAYDEACTKVEELEAKPGNCKKIVEIQTESAFVKAVEVLLGDAINKQTAKTLEEVLAEEEARRQARRAKTAAKKAAKSAK